MLRIATIVMMVTLTAGSAQSDRIHYTLSPVLQGGKLKALAIEMALTGENDGETEIALPDKWGGNSELWRGITQFRVLGAKSITTGGDPARRFVQHAPGARLTVRYRLKQFWAGEPDSREYRPIVRPGYFQIIGSAAFARTKWSSTTAVSVSFKGFPKRWGFASDLEHGKLALYQVMESVTVGGDFRVFQAGKLRVAIRGPWASRGESFIKRLEPIIASQNKFWGDVPGRFLVTVLTLPSNPNHAAYSGTNLRDAVAFIATEDADERQLTRGLAHEHMHTWIPIRVGKQPQENYGLVDAWLSEGFTDFYTYRLLARDGLWSVEEMTKVLNQAMWTYAFSPVRNAANAQIASEFWRDDKVLKMPYLRGLLIAAFLDARLRRESGHERDLDDVMLAMKRAFDAADVDAKPSLRAHFIVSMKAAGVDATDEIERFVESGETVRLPADIWAHCGVVEASEVAEFYRGFKGGRTKANGNIVVGVDPDGPAHAAGLRDGMRILDLDLSGGRDSRVPVTYKVVVDGEVREITYLPAGKRRETVQELKLAALGEAGRKACAAQLGGLR